MSVLEYFSSNYEESRYKFRQNLSEIKKVWPEAVLESYPLKNIPNNNGTYTIDLINTSPGKKPKKDKDVILITSGLHGVEGYTGTAVINLFIKEFAPDINSEKNELILIHAINPWGMKNFRRTNENNVDLNRNFVEDWNGLNKNCNKNYPKLNGFFNPKGALNADSDEAFYNDLSHYMSEVGPEGIKEALTLGQFEFPRGIYYGGNKYEESTLFIIECIQKIISSFSRLIFLDIHTGYGPRGNLSIITSPYEKKTASEISEIIKYDDIVAATENDFYRIEGDIVDYSYFLFTKENRQDSIFGGCLEYGTWNDDLADTVNFIKVFFQENRLYHYGSVDEKTTAKIKKEFIEILFPGDEEWRYGVISNTRKAYDAVFNWTLR